MQTEMICHLLWTDMWAYGPESSNLQNAHDLGTRNVFLPNALQDGCGLLELLLYYPIQVKIVHFHKQPQERSTT